MVRNDDPMPKKGGTGHFSGQLSQSLWSVKLFMPRFARPVNVAPITGRQGAPSFEMKCKVAATASATALASTTPSKYI
jgi:hypothetical protein